MEEEIFDRTSILDRKTSLVSRIIHQSMIVRILNEGSFLVSQICEDTGYSVTTVSKHLQEMLNEGLIFEMERISIHNKGRKSIKYGTSPDSCYFLGVDPKAFGLAFGVLNLVGKMVTTGMDENYVLKNTYDAYEGLCASIDRYIASLSESVRSKLRAMCINVPGRVNGRLGTSASYFNFDGHDNMSLTEMLSERFGIPVFIENDSKAMTYAEYVTSSMDKHANMCYVNFSWGLGVGIIIDGKLYVGKDGYSGEYGHIHRYDNNVFCSCGKKGCIETELSGKAISRKLKERIKAGETSILSQKVKAGETITTEDILRAIEMEDSLTIELTIAAGTELGHQLSGMVNLLNPDRIVIGGEFARIEPCYFLQYITLAIRQYSLKLISRSLPVVSSSLGSKAGVIGACYIARNRYFNLKMSDIK